MVFNGKKWSISSVIHQVRISHDEFVLWFPSKKVIDHAREFLVHWKPPPSGSVKLNIDVSYVEAASRMGYGGILRPDARLWLSGFSSSDGEGDELLAEIIAVQKRLSLAWDLGYKRVCCEIDALEVVKLLQNRSNIMLHAQVDHLMLIVELLDRDWQVDINHILREANSCADHLAKLASINALGYKVWADPLLVWALSCFGTLVRILVLSFCLLFVLALCFLLCFSPKKSHRCPT